MADLDDEIYLLFLEESQEHLEDIETDLLEMEDQRENLDSDLVNKIFRAVHTVKGGSGFFGLTKIQSLAHAMENLLGMVRNGDLIVTPPLISLLLDGADLLKRMVHSPETMEEIEIDETLLALKNFLDTPAESAQKISSHSEKGEVISSKKIEETLDVTLPDGTTIFQVSKRDIINAQKSDGGGNFIYLIVYDLYEDIEKKGRAPQDVIAEYTQLTYFIESKIDISAVGTLDNPNPTLVLPFYILCATVMDPEIMSEFAGVPKERVSTFFETKVTLETAIRQPQEEKEERAIPTVDEIIIPEREEGVTSGPPKENSPSIPTPEGATHSVEKKIVQKEEKTAPPAAKKGSGGSIRIPVDQLEHLMNLAGELVLTRNELIQKVASLPDGDIHQTAQRVNSITSELQEAIMVTRMQSIDIVFSKFKRVVRDLSKQLGKKVDLTIEGEEVELDRTIVEAIGDPLTHMVRNSIDHGIEMPDTRIKAGKNGTGTLKLIAQHEAGQVLIIIKDDGGGIDPEKIGYIAVKKGIITEQERQSMVRKELIKLIFRPGFSTAEAVSDVSGRGVGMDVVMSSLSKVGGVVDVDSTVGKGTTIKIKLPLTLAIIPSLLLETGKERFAIPQVNLVELVRIRAENVKTQIEWLGEAVVLKLRGELLPLVRLSDILEMPATFAHPETGEHSRERRVNIADRRSKILSSNTKKEIRQGGRRNSATSALNIAIVSAGEVSYGIIVDSLLDSEEIVVKPLGKHLKECHNYAGATILGDGHVAMILDIAHIRDSAILRSVHEQLESQYTKKEVIQQKADVYSYLLFRNNEKELFAVPMDLIARIEKVATENIKRVGPRKAIKYRGDTLIILDITDVADIQPIDQKDEYSIIVFEAGGVEMGLMVAKVLDIISYGGAIDDHSYKQPGIMGSAVIEDRITMLVDLYMVAQILAPDIVSQTRDHGPDENEERQILIVEDSLFFLKQITLFIEEAGYKTYTAENGQEALEILQENHVDLVLTDIEMPIMNGLELTQAIRADENYKALPIIAVTSISGIEAEQKGKEAGVDRYLIKMDKEQILKACKECITAQ